MDFLSSYIPPSPTKFTPKGSGTKFEELPPLRAPCDEKQLESMRSGNYDELRKLRSGLQKRTSQVQFIAPLSEDGESLQSIKLTPKTKDGSNDDQVQTPAAQIAPNAQHTGKKSLDHRPKERKSKIFGFKFRRSESQPDIDP